MAKEEGITVEGKVLSALGCGRFKVELDNGMTVIARVSGKMAQKFIIVKVDDTVLVEVSPYDLEHGRITYRNKK